MSVAHAYANGNGYSHGYSHGNINANCHGYCDIHAHSYGDCNCYEYANTSAYSNCNCYEYANTSAYSNGNSHGDGYVFTNANAYATVPIAHNGLLSAGRHDTEWCSQHRQSWFYGAAEV